MSLNNCLICVLVTFVKTHALGIVIVFSAILILVIGAAIFVVIYFSKLMSRKSLENERYLQLCDLSNEYIYEYDYIADKLILSEKSAKMLGEKTTQEHFLHEARLNGNEYGFSTIISEKTEGTTEICVPMADRSLRWLRVTEKIVRDGAGRPQYAVGKVADIQMQKEQEERLFEKAQRDGLTELYNAAASRTLISAQLTSSKQGGVLFVIDIDHFKDVNDSFGHYFGDKLLVETAKIIKRAFRSEDIIGRLGGDEFVVYAGGILTKAETEKRFKLIGDRMSSLKIEGLDRKLAISAGAVNCAFDKTFDELYKAADKALYSVKQNGKNDIKIDFD